MRRLACLLLLLAPLHAAETRYHQYTRKAKGSGGQVKVVASTLLGGPGAQELVGVAYAPDGGVLVAGNAWGPRLELGAVATVWGTDTFRDAPVLTRDAKPKLDRANPNRAGFVVRLSEDLQRVEAVSRLGWGCGTFTGLQTGPDGGVYLAATLQSGGLAWAERLPGAKVDPLAGDQAGGAALALVRLSADLRSPQWAAVCRRAERQSADAEKHVGGRTGLRVSFLGERELVLMAYGRLWSLGGEGQTLRPLGASRGGVLLGADPRRGLLYSGGDENTKTGREPWRRPFLIQYGREGQPNWECWRWDSKLVGTDKYRLVSDSSVRGVAPLDGSKLLVWGWSDGGNSVFLRQPRDLDADAHFKAGFIDSLWGAGVGSFAWLMTLDTDTQQTLGGSVMCAFLTEKNKPNSSRIDGGTLLDGRRLALVGSSAFAFVETPDAWVKTAPAGSGGAYFAIMSENLGELLFASVLPGVDDPLALARRGQRVAIVGTARQPKPEAVPPLLVKARTEKVVDEADGYVLVADVGAG